MYNYVLVKLFLGYITKFHAKLNKWFNSKRSYVI